MYFEKEKRQKFAGIIVAAASISGSYEGDKFIEKFSEIQGIKGSDLWINKVAEWIKYGHPKEIAGLIKTNYNNPKIVFDYLSEKVKPI